MYTYTHTHWLYGQLFIPSNRSTSSSSSVSSSHSFYFSSWSLVPVGSFKSFLLLNLSIGGSTTVFEGLNAGETEKRNVLARICGRDKRVPDVIKLPREKEPAALRSELFHEEEEESIGQQRRPYPPSSFPRTITRLGYLENSRTGELATKFVFPPGRNLRIYLLSDGGAP